jgi:phosphoenolpyruvate carboxylase
VNPFNSIVTARFSIYNSLFLNLPFQNISQTGNFLPLLQQVCEQGYSAGMRPDEIMAKFFADYSPESTPAERFDFMFRVIQYIERQVVLFDSIEDSSYEQINDVRGKGSVPALLLRAESDGKLDQLRKSLTDFSVRVVLTAHPTQFYPGHVLAIHSDLETAIRQNDLPQINLLLQQLGKTGFINKQKPTPFDEAVSLCWYLENIFYHAAPAIALQLMRGLNIPIEAWQNDQLVSIGFWPGGVIENIFQVPAQAHRFIEWCWFLLVDESCLSQLLKQEIDLGKVVLPDRSLEIGVNRQHVAWIELCGVCCQHYAHGEVGEAFAELIEFSI